MLDLMDSMLSMKMDVYRQFDAQDSDTGAIVKTWNFFKTVDCHAKGIVSNTASSGGGDKQVFSNKYLNEQSIQVRTSQKITTREKVTGIRDSSNNYIWTELNYPTDTPTVFEIMGTTPITDPFGKVIGYNAIMKRSENQQIGL